MIHSWMILVASVMGVSKIIDVLAKKIRFILQISSLLQQKNQFED